MNSVQPGERYPLTQLPTFNCIKEAHCILSDEGKKINSKG